MAHGAERPIFPSQSRTTAIPLTPCAKRGRISLAMSELVQFLYDQHQTTGQQAEQEVERRERLGLEDALEEGLIE